MKPKSTKAPKLKPKSTKAPKLRKRRLFKPPSTEYMRGCFDTLDKLSTLAYMGPIFLQVLATMGGSDIEIPGVEKHTREKFKKDFAKERNRAKTRNRTTTGKVIQ